MHLNPFRSRDNKPQQPVTPQAQPPFNPAWSSPAPPYNSFRQPRPNTVTPIVGSTTNTNTGTGTFNNVIGDQLNENDNSHYGDYYEGDRFEGPIHGGNVGGRGNTNTIYNRSSPFDRRIEGGGDRLLSGLRAKIEYLKAENHRLMDELQFDEKQKLEQRIEELETTNWSLRRRASGN